MQTIPEGAIDRPVGVRHPSAWWLVAGTVVLAVVFTVGLVLGGEMSAFLSQSIRVLPFVPLAVLTYYGMYYRWARMASLIWLACLVMGIALAATLSALGAMAPDLATAQGLALGSDGLTEITLTAAGTLAAMCVGLLGFVRPVRVLAARVLPLDPDSFVHTVALAAVVTLALESFVPLIVTGEPALIALISGMLDGGVDLGVGAGDTLRGELYGLFWILVGALFAVGLGVKRDLRAALRRLGLVRPGGTQVIQGVAIGLGLVFAVAVLSMGIDWLWRHMGWTTSGGTGFDEAFGTLLAPFLTPVGAVVLGLSAGLGEEVAVRGVLQPRMGVLLSNLLFTGLHAFQYHWDSLLVVFLLGSVLGLIRRRTNTTTSVIVHGVYDFVLVMAMMAQLPLIGE